tara:strand:- start:7013 stop:7249 length:237 start_codon:yes stop_codon:yes gene_type:complete
MKLIFSKNEENVISVTRKVGDNTSEFGYVDMVKSLIKTHSLEEPEIEGEFSDAEKESITKMVEHINAEVAEFYSEEEE